MRALIIAPPSVALMPHEHPEELSKWRIVEWPLDGHGWLARTPDSDSTAQVLPTAAVLGRLGIQRRAWVSAIMRLQLAQHEAFAIPQAGGLSGEERSRRAARRLLELRDELRAAFPDEDWYESQQHEIPVMPDTDTELLAAIAGARANPDDADTSRAPIWGCDSAAHQVICSQLATSWPESVDPGGARKDAREQLDTQTRRCREAVARLLSAHPGSLPGAQRPSNRTDPIAHALLSDVLSTGPKVVADNGRMRVGTAFSSSAYPTMSPTGFAFALAGWALVQPGQSASYRGCAQHGDRHLERRVPLYERRRVEQRLDRCGAALVLSCVTPRNSPAPTLLDIPGWATVVRSIPDEAVKLVQASSTAYGRPGTLNANLVYRSARHPNRLFSAAVVQQTIESLDFSSSSPLAAEWTWLNATLANHAARATSVMVFKGSVIDPRTDDYARLLVFVCGDQREYFVMPFSSAGDPFPDLDVPGGHPAVQRKIARAADEHMQPPRERANEQSARLVTQYLYVDAKECSPNDTAVAVAVNVTGPTLGTRADLRELPSGS